MSYDEDLIAGAVLDREAELLEALRAALRLLERHRGEYSTHAEQRELARLREIAA